MTTTPMTLTQARDRVRQYLDDPKGRRWTDAQVNAALQTNIRALVEQMASAGVTTFAENVAFTTTATAPYVEVADKKPVLILAVSVTSNQYTTLLRTAPPEENWFPDTTARVGTLRLIADPVLPTANDDPLFAYKTTQQSTDYYKTTPTIDACACAMAACELQVKDNEQGAITTLRDNLLTSVLVGNTPLAAKPFPRTSPQSFSAFYDAADMVVRLGFIRPYGDITRLSNVW